MFNLKCRKYIILDIIILSNMLFNPLIMLLSYASTINNVNDNGLFAGGNGTKESPYLISTSEQLKNIENDLNASYKLINDIDLTYDTSNENGIFYNNGEGWNPIQGIFKGTLNGNRKKIIGLKQHNNSKPGTGLFNRVLDANIYDLDIIDVKITYSRSSTYEYPSSMKIGTIAWYIENSKLNSVNLSGEIEIINNEAHYSSTDISDRVGGFASTISGCDLVNCTNSINIKSTFPGKYGGFAAIASNQNNLTFCVNNGNIQAINTECMENYHIGGLVAFVERGTTYFIPGTNFISCTNNGKLTGKSVAGIVSYSDCGNITFCNNYGELNIFSNDSGGIIGEAHRTNIEECFNIGTLNVYASMSDDNADIGGIVGVTYYNSITDKRGNIIDYSNTLKNIYNAGTINVYSSNIDANIGGIIGYLKGHIQLCYNLGKVDLTNFDFNAKVYRALHTTPQTSGTFEVGTIIRRCRWKFSFF